MSEVHQQLDSRGQNCPLPILHARKKLDTMQSDEVLEILATDPGAVADFKAFCRKTGHELLESVQEGDIYRFQIKRVG